MSMWSMNMEGVVSTGYIRRHGEGRYEVCLDNGNAVTPYIKEAAKVGAIVYAEVLLGGLVSGVGIQVHTKPYIDRSQLCLSLHAKFNDVWEELWLAGKPVLVKFVIRR